MSATKNSILSAIDELHNLDNQATMHVCESMVDVYCKACTILENCEEDSDISSFSIFKEGYYMEEDEITKTEDGGYKINGSDQTYYKDKGFRRMKDDGSGLESILWSILAAIPRMIKAAIEAMFGKNSVSSEDVENTKKKGEAVEKTMKSVPSEIFEKFIEGTKHIGSIIGENLDNLDKSTVAGFGGVAGLITALVIHLDKKKKAKLEAKKYYNDIVKNIDNNPYLKKIFNNAYILVYDKDGNPQDPILLDFEFLPDPNDKNNIKVKTDINFDGIVAFYKGIHAVFDEVSDMYSHFLNGDGSDSIVDLSDKFKPIDQFYKPGANTKDGVEYLTADEISAKFKEIFDAREGLKPKMEQVGEYVTQFGKKLEDASKSSESEDETNTINDQKKINKQVNETLASLTKSIIITSESLTFFVDQMYYSFKYEIDYFNNLSNDEYKALFTSGEDDQTHVNKIIDFFKNHNIQINTETPAALQNILNFVKSIPGKIAAIPGQIKDKVGTITGPASPAPGNPPEGGPSSVEPGGEPPVENTEENTEENPEETSVEGESFYFNFRG